MLSSEISRKIITGIREENLNSFLRYLKIEVEYLENKINNLIREKKEITKLLNYQTKSSEKYRRMELKLQKAKDNLYPDYKAQYNKNVLIEIEDLIRENDMDTESQPINVIRVKNDIE